MAHFSTTEEQARDLLRVVRMIEWTELMQRLVSGQYDAIDAALAQPNQPTEAC